jgi:hypothetical protein
MFATRVIGEEPSEEAALAQSSQRGSLLYAYDQAAWHGTDDMLAKLQDPSAKLEGYIVDGPVGAPRLIFFNKAGTSAVYIATFEGARLIQGHVLRDDEDRELSALDRRMVSALAVARAAIAKDSSARPCVPRPFNTAVLPPETEAGPVSVYFLTPRTDNVTIPFGGHFQIQVDAQGKAGPVRRYSNSCLNMPIKPDLPKGTKPEAVFVTHLLDRVPTEIHVFNSLALRSPIMVGTLPSKKVWPVVGATIQNPVALPE